MNVVANQHIHCVQSSDQESVHEVFVSVCVPNVQDNRHIRPHCQMSLQQ